MEQYRTHTAYIQYYFGPKNDLSPPGAGDLLAAVLDVSIVALAIPMFNYRAELKRHVQTLLLDSTNSVYCHYSAKFGDCSCLAIRLSFDLCADWN